MAQVSPSRAMDKFMLRLPSGMRGRIAGAAAANNRSMNAEIVSLLKAGLEEDLYKGVPDFATQLATQQFVDTINKMEGMLEQLLRQNDALSKRLSRIEQGRGTAQ